MAIKAIIGTLWQKKYYFILPKILFLKLIQRIRKKILLSSSPQSSDFEKIIKIFGPKHINHDQFSEIFFEERKLIMELSEKILNKRFKLLGCTFEFNQKINWHYDPSSKKSWDLKFYDERHINYPGSPQDPKIVWELNRQQYLFILAKAYNLTGEERYSRGIIEIILSWINDNPFGKGINWASPLEISIRLISWIFSLDLIEDSEDFKKNKRIIFSSIFQQIKYLSMTLSIDRIIRTNHLLGELAGVFVVSSIFSFPHSQKLRNKSIKILLSELKKQVYEDGVSKEQSTSYHRFIIDFIILVVFFSKKSGYKYPNEINEILNKMIKYLCHITMPDGLTPAIGDSDDGRGFMLSQSSNFWDMRDSISTGSILFKSGEMKFFSKKFYEESYWLFGSIGFDMFNEIDVIHPKKTVKLFTDSGHYIFRNSYSDCADYLYLRGGEFGMGGNGFCSHSHDDLLSPIICFKGTQLFVDSGTYSYNNEKSERNKFKISNAHNNIVWINSISIPKPNFGWERIYNARLVSKKIDPDNISLEFKIDKIEGYKRIVNYSLKKSLFLIEDLFDEDFGELELNFHISPNIKLEKKNEIIIGSGKNSLILSIQTNYNVRIKPEKISLNYRELIDTQVINGKVNVRKGDTLSTKIF